MSRPIVLPLHRVRLTRCRSIIQVEDEFQSCLSSCRTISSGTRDRPELIAGSSGSTSGNALCAHHHRRPLPPLDVLSGSGTCSWSRIISSLSADGMSRGVIRVLGCFETRQKLGKKQYKKAITSGPAYVRSLVSQRYPHGFPSPSIHFHFLFFFLSSTLVFSFGLSRDLPVPSLWSCLVLFIIRSLALYLVLPPPRSSSSVSPHQTLCEFRR